MEQVTLKVNGMSCGHCVNTIEGALKEKGITGSVDLKAGTVSVQYDAGALELEDIKQLIEDQGYDVV